jgi:hypothetical protein
MVGISATGVSSGKGGHLSKYLAVGMLISYEYDGSWVGIRSFELTGETTSCMDCESIYY